MAFIGQVFKVEDAQAVTSGTIVNLSRDQTMNLIVSGLQLQPEVRIYEGGKVVGTNSLASLILGDFIIGALLDPLGTQILGTRKVASNNQWVIESPAIGIIDRQSVFEPLQTGVIFVSTIDTKVAST